MEANNPFELERLLAGSAAALPPIASGLGKKTGMSRVLIVDDDEGMAQTLARAMNLHGFSTAWRTSAADALLLLADEEVDVVVTDLHMAEMDGLSFCERVVARWPCLPVVMITAFGSVDSAEAAIRVGAFDFITKPFDIEELRRVLARAVQRRADRQSRKG